MSIGPVTNKNEPDSGECVICADQMRDAVISIVCGHSYCLKCIEQWKSQKPSCPLCNKQITQIIPNYTVREMINSKTAVVQQAASAVLPSLSSPRLINSNDLRAIELILSLLPKFNVLLTDNMLCEISPVLTKSLCVALIKNSRDLYPPSTIDYFERLDEDCAAEFILKIQYQIWSVSIFREKLHLVREQILNPQLIEPQPTYKEYAIRCMNEFFSNPNRDFNFLLDPLSKSMDLALALKIGQHYNIPSSKITSCKENPGLMLVLALRNKAILRDDPIALQGFLNTLLDLPE